MLGSLIQNSYYIAGENPKTWSPAFYSLLLGPIGLFAEFWSGWPIQFWFCLPPGYFLLPERIRSPYCSEF
jgi:hypothetical protein